MEISQEHVHCVKPERRVYKDIRFTLDPADFTQLPISRFQDTNGGGSNSDTPGRLSDRMGGLVRDAKSFGMHLVLRDVISLHWAKSCRANMQGHEDMRNGGQNFRRKVQAGGRRRERTVGSRENSLIARFVLGSVGSHDIRRQRHQSAMLKIDFIREEDLARSIRKIFPCFRRYAFDRNCRARAKSSSRLDQHLPPTRGELLEKQKFYSAIIGKMSRRQDAGIVQHE